MKVSVHIFFAIKSINRILLFTKTLKNSKSQKWKDRPLSSHDLTITKVLMPSHLRFSRLIPFADFSMRQRRLEGR